MSIRAAKFADIPRVIEVLREASERSIYARTAEFDRELTRQMLARAMNRHGHHNNGGSMVMVSEKEGVVEGIMVGILDSVYPVFRELMVTDLLFVFSEQAPARDARDMIRALIQWAESNPKVIEIHLGVTSAVGDWERTGKLYERLGLERCGAMYRREIRHVESG